VEADDLAGSIFDEELPNALHSVFSGTDVIKASMFSNKEGKCGTGGVDMDGGGGAWKSGISGSILSTRLEDIDVLTFMDEVGGVLPTMLLVTFVELDILGDIITDDDVLVEGLVLAITEWLLFKISESGGVDMDGGGRAWKSGISGTILSTRLEDIDVLTFMDEVGGVLPIMFLVTLVELDILGDIITDDDVLDEGLVLAITEWYLY
jgi:hypothetical protein